MKIEIKTSPLSVNKAYKGRRFSTPEYKKLEADVCRLIGRNKEEQLKGELWVRYIFYIKNYKRSDVCNMEKTITDIIKKLGYMRDDSDIKVAYIRKEKVEKYEDEKIEITIYQYDSFKENRF
jgi:Holliday junction resolvase RusA-like endonuclease